MAERIQVTSEELRETGRELNRNAKNYEKAMDNAVRLVLGLTGSKGWTGAAQQVYAKQMKKLQSGINQMTQHIAAYQNSLENAAQQFDSVEKKNSSQAGGLQTDVF